MYLTELKQEFSHRFHESDFYHSKSGKPDVRRYTDKLRAMQYDPFIPSNIFFDILILDWERIPIELNWKVERKTKLDKRKRKMDDESIKKRLEKLAKAEIIDPENEVFLIKSCSDLNMFITQKDVDNINFLFLYKISKF